MEFQSTAMKQPNRSLVTLALVVACLASLGADFSPVSDWLKLPPAPWRPGFVLSPHGVAVNAHGDVFVSEFNLFGRVHRFDRR